jgi:hypothetical protein
MFIIVDVKLISKALKRNTLLSYRIKKTKNLSKGHFEYFPRIRKIYATL